MEQLSGAVNATIILQKCFLKDVIAVSLRQTTFGVIWYELKKKVLSKLCLLTNNQAVLSEDKEQLKYKVTRSGNKVKYELWENESLKRKGGYFSNLYVSIQE